MARARADLEHTLVRLDSELLQDARLHFGCPHELPAIPFTDAQWSLHVGERERAVGRRYELFALDDEQQIEHRLVEHVPGSHLLLNHVEARLFDV